MPKTSELAEIVVNGQAYTDWKSVQVTRTFGDSERGAISNFAFTAASPIESGKTWSGMKLRVGDKCSIRMAGRTVLPGVISVRQVAYDAIEHGLQIQGLSKVSDIVHSTVEAKPGEFKNYSLQQIANSVLKPYGIKFVLKGQTAGAEKVFERVNVQVGETVFALIERLCRMRNLFLVDDVEGNLVGYRGGARPKPIADLEEGRNIKVAQIVMSDEQALSKIEAIGQNTGTNERFGDASRDVSATVTNSAVTRHRPLVFAAEMPGDQQDMKMRAEHEMATNYVTMLQGSITVQGWLRDDGTSWIEHVGETVSVHSPMVFPDDRMDLAIQGVTLKQDDASGTETVIELVLPGRLNGGNSVTASAGGIPNLTGA